MPEKSIPSGMFTTCISFLLLAICLIFVNIKFLPVIVQIFDGLGLNFGTIANLSFRVAPYVLPILIIAMISAFLIARKKRSEKTVQATTFAFSVGNLILVSYLILLSGVFYDLAVQLPYGLSRLLSKQINHGQVQK